jgi:hypothetical protein
MMMPEIEIGGEIWVIFPHAEIRMFERDVSENWVRRTIEEPESTGIDIKGNEVYRRTFSAKSGKVLVRVMADEEVRHIITVTIDEV